MRRQKAVKRTTKRTTSLASTQIQKLEKEFMGTPATLASAFSKEVSAHKQKENQLKQALAKGKTVIKTAESRLKAASKNKQTAAGKKQFNSLKKIHREVTQANAAIVRDLKDASNNVQTVTIKQARMLALGKHLQQFNKEWAKTERQLKAKAQAKLKAKAKTKTRAKRSTPKITPLTAKTTSTFVEDSYYTNETPSMHDENKETTESNS